MGYQYVKNSRQRLKLRLTYVMGDQCCICGYNKCRSALEFHHTNPLEKDFTISSNANVAYAKAEEEIKKCIMVCANCHREIHEGLITNIPESSYIPERGEEIRKELEDLKSHKTYYCKHCGAKVSKGQDQCVKCSNIQRRKADRPDRETLKELIRIDPFTQIAEAFGVTDNAVRKWCDVYNLPRKKKDINSYSDEEWEKI